MDRGTTRPWAPFLNRFANPEHELSRRSERGPDVVIRADDADFVLGDDDRIHEDLLGGLDALVIGVDLPSPGGTRRGGQRARCLTITAYQTTEQGRRRSRP